jgi:opine dehydrogenase
MGYLVVGAGNVGLGTAALLMNDGHNVHLFSRRQLPLLESKTLEVSGQILQGKFPLTTCTDDLEVIVKAYGGKLPDRIVIACRGNDIEAIAQLLYPYITSDMSILLLCSARFASLAFHKVLQKCGCSISNLPAVADVRTSPIVSRGNAIGLVNLSAFKETVRIAAPVPTMTEQVIKNFPTFSNLRAEFSYLGLSLAKLDDIVHIPLILTGWLAVESGQGHNIYRSATTSNSHLLEKMDHERLEIGKALRIDLLNVCAAFQESYGTVGESVLEHFQQVKAFDNAIIQDPKHRYLYEDVAFGLCQLQALARAVNIKTPILDGAIALAYGLADLPQPWQFTDQELLQLA